MERRKALKTAAVAALALGGTALLADNHGGKDHGIASKEGMNRVKMTPADPKNPTNYELKHMPEIKLGKTDGKGFTSVKITVGKNGIIHPSTADHWIDYIELWADNKLVGKNELQPVISRGYTTFKINTAGVKKLTAVAGCNLHGIWEDSITL